ncbi:MAG TPA: deoxyribonuclease V [Vicinamibacterales bacterium]|nr:deoxyribonuclease V [Vicinamibacterales bacterium]
MRPLSLHPWRVSYRQAVEIQRQLRPRLRVEPLPADVRLVAGADVAYARAAHRMLAAVVIVELPSLQVVEAVEADAPATFPYIPGLFTFREVPPLLRALERLETTPDAMLFDGHGLAHPRRFGLACHAGVLLDVPSVGCAKSLLVGEHAPPGPRRGDAADIVHEGDIVGAAVRTRPGVAPVYVSIGHRVDLASAVRLVLATARRYRMPEPLRLAHQATTRLRARLGRAGPVVAREYPDFIREETE